MRVGPTSVSGKITGLKPGLHGFHIPEYGDTTNGCMSTGASRTPARVSARVLTPRAARRAL